jgi:hypothetical protein
MESRWIGAHSTMGVRRPRRPLVVATMLAVLVLAAGAVLWIAFLLGLGGGRRSLAGGFGSGLEQPIELVLGLVASALLGFVALRARPGSRRLGALTVACLATGWLGWFAGNWVADADGRGARYSGSAEISAGSQVLGSALIRCYSVIGDAKILAAVGMPALGFDVLLRDRVDRTPKPGVWGEAILPGGTVSFGTTSYTPVDRLAAGGLDGNATVSATVIPAAGGAGAPTDVTSTWTCDPATRSDL